jgi:hypothetical protein
MAKPCGLIIIPLLIAYQLYDILDKNLQVAIFEFAVGLGAATATWHHFFPHSTKTVQIFWDKIAVWLKLFRYSGTKLPFG